MPDGTLIGTVLYIEDDPVSSSLVEEILLTLHPHLTLLRAATGAEGVRLAREQHPDLVLLDMHLPDTSGLEVIRELNREIAAGAFRIVLLTADRISADVIKALSLGAYEYWAKPINIPQFDRGVRRALSGAPALLPMHLAQAIGGRAPA
ncbi:response regulator [Aquincola sp. S2]|uniref:Response regulator n=1 Tax=Pseudaquabacterium terrae TaxID=2732868 RepID=A0ABX2EQE8_9BURK|nr:response regulator [Aquabacterium terrae]